MNARYAWALALLLASVCAAQDALRVRETQPKRPVTGDSVINYSPSRPHPVFPPKALAEGALAERPPENTDWAAARWTRATLQLPGTTQKAIAVAAPGTVLVRASWAGPSAVAVTVVMQGSTLATAKSTKRFDGEMVATAQARVPSAGEIVIRAAGSGSQPVKVDLYVGVLAAAP